MNLKRTHCRIKSGLLHGLAVTALMLLGVASAQATNIIVSTPFGDVEIELFDEAKPQTVANFLNYVNDGDYQNSFFHRSIPGFIIQSGGFTFADGTVGVIPTDPPVVNEPGISNLRGTLAMAKTAEGPDSATNGWYINLGDNSTDLDNQNGGFTVFGQVVGDGMTVVDQIAALTIWDAGGALTDWPLIDYVPPANVAAGNIVFSNIAIKNDLVINAGMNDLWVSDDADFQGIFFSVFPDLGLIFMAWYTYDTVRPEEGVTATLGGPGQRWITALGSYDGRFAELRAELTTGGVFNASDPEAAQESGYGTFNIEFNHCDEALVDFDIPAAEQSGSFVLTRAVKSNIELCQMLSDAAQP